MCCGVSCAARRLVQTLVLLVLVSATAVLALADRSRGASLPRVMHEIGRLLSPPTSPNGPGPPLLDTVAVTGRTVFGGGDDSVMVYARPRHGWAGRVRSVTTLTDSGAVTLGETLAASGGAVFSGSLGVGGTAFPTLDVFTRPRAGWRGDFGQLEQLGTSDGSGLVCYFTCGGGGPVGFPLAAFASTVATVGATGTLPDGYVFSRPARGWQFARDESATLMPPPGFGFGNGTTGVAISGPTIVVGPAFDANDRSQRAFYVYRRPSGGWHGAILAAATLTASDGAILGPAIATSGSTIMIAATRRTPSGRTVPTVDIFTRPTGGWTGTIHQSGRLIPPQGATAAHYAASIAMTSRFALVGSPNDGTHRHGAVYLFTRPAHGWRGTIHPASTLLRARPRAGDNLGQAIAIANQLAFVTDQRTIDIFRFS